ncbi:MAG: hypothetical protein ACJ788_24395 [Ktedonobacteraceae bacterium]
MNKDAYLLLDLDEPMDVQCQKNCEREIEETLVELLGLVGVTEMPLGSRLHLVDGLNHIRHHIKAQTGAMTSEISGRKC